MSTRVYQYGLLPPHHEAARVREQMRLNHIYRNTLTEIERGRRAALRELDATHVDLVALVAAAKEAREAEEAAVKELRATRAKTRSRSESEAQRAAVTAARERRRATARALIDHRRVARGDEAMVAARDAISERAGELRRSARAHCGVYWGTYLLAEDAMQAAAKAPLYENDLPSDPAFLRWRDEGAVGVQIQAGQPGDDINGTYLQIDPVNERAWNDPVRGLRRLYSRTKVRMRVGSDGRDPIWAEWHMIMHRPLPKGSVIKRARISVRRCAAREYWALELTVTVDDAAVARPSLSGAVAIDVGWRVMPEGLRVATWQDDSGRSGELLLPLDTGALGGIAQSDSLRSIRDKNFDTVRASLATWLGANTVPDWLKHAAATLPQWKSIERLTRLALRWRRERFDGDDEGYETIEAWRYNDHHLWCWEAERRLRAVKHRREQYRKLAAQLTSKYATVVLEDFDLREVARRPAAEQGATNETARRHRFLAAVGDLRMAIRSAASIRGCEVATVPSVNTTRTCNRCGRLERWDQENLVYHACGGCGALWDQDYNAALNLLERWERSKSEKETEPKEKKESRWKRARAARSERDARNEKRQPGAVEA